MEVLVIEDELLIQKSLSRLLEMRNASVTAVSQGKEAIRHLQSKKFDRVICDLMLQDMNGFDVLETAKNYFSKEEIAEKFFIISAYTSEQVLERAKTYGCLVEKKPFYDLNLFLQKLMEERVH